MELAFLEARQAMSRGEVPIGCVLLNKAGAVVAKGSNRTTEFGNATAHAEMVAFETLTEPLEERSLVLAVTCEPCIMCASAIMSTGVVGRIVFGCKNPRFGGCGSVRDLKDYVRSDAPPRELPAVVSGVQADRAVSMLSQFYTRVNPNAPVPRKKRRHNDT